MLRLNMLLQSTGEKEKEVMWNNYDANGFLGQAVDFIADRHVEKQIVSISVHHDESNPREHIVVIPVAEKKIRWENQKGEGERIEMRMNAREFTEGEKSPEVARQLFRIY